MDNWDFNEHVYDESHYTDWNDKLGKNFTHNNGIHNDMMYQKNIETGGGYQATVSGMCGVFTTFKQKVIYTKYRGNANDSSKVHRKIQRQQRKNIWIQTTRYQWRDTGCTA